LSKKLIVIDRPKDDSEHWRGFYAEQVEPFWRTVEQRNFVGVGEKRIHWAFYKVSEYAPLIVISPGRIEATAKYQELMWELAQAGISSAVIDHRGQGQSERLTENSHQGHVEKFQDFVDDFALFHEQTVKEFPNAVRRWLVGHSMGGAIVSQFCSDYQHPYQRLVLTSPMFSINTAGIPIAVAQAVVTAGARLNRWLRPSKPWYFLGMGDYKPVAFEKNDLTHSLARYRLFREQYQQSPELQLGGPTFTWLDEALRVCKRLTAVKLSIDIPVTLFQAGADSVVSADGQNRFAELNTVVNKRVIAGARHELLMESDEYRQPVVDELLRING